MSHGGKRVGAGRPTLPAEEKKVAIAMRVAPITKKRIVQMRDANIPVTMLIEQYIEQMYAEWLDIQEPL